MPFSAALFVSVLIPGIFAILVSRWWDRREPEPRSVLARIFSIGIGLGLLIAVAEIAIEIIAVSANIVPAVDRLAISDGLGVFILVVLAIAVIEEALKYAWLGTLFKRTSSLSQVVDGAVYASVLAWGAAMSQNILVITLPLINPPHHAMIPFSFLFHAIFFTLLTGVCSGIVGLGVAEYMSTLRTRRDWLSTVGRSLLEAIALHAVFLFLVFIHEERLAGLVTVLAAAYLFSRFAFHPLMRPVKPSSPAT